MYGTSRDAYHLFETRLLNIQSDAASSTNGKPEKKVNWRSLWNIYTQRTFVEYKLIWRLKKKYANALRKIFTKRIIKKNVYALIGIKKLRVRDENLRLLAFRFQILTYRPIKIAPVESLRWRNFIFKSGCARFASVWIQQRLIRSLLS